MQSAAPQLRGLGATAATGQATSADCRLHSIRCTASSSGVLTVREKDGSGKQIFTSLAVAANTVYPVGGAGGGALGCVGGVHVTLVSGTATWEVQVVD